MMSGGWNDRSWWPEPDEADVSLARENLDQILVAYKENPEKVKESLKYKDEVMNRKEVLEKEKYRSPLYKVGGGEVKRRKRGIASDEDDAPKESFVIKVFERSVDFGQFPENAPLYPMARAWIRNLSQTDKSSWNDIPNADDDRENPPKEMSPEGLLEQHITRWREIRRKWKAACRENEERYRDSYIILREMYDKFCKDLP